VTRDARWIGQRSFYVQYGDWFLLVCVALATLGFIIVNLSQPAAPSAPEPRSRCSNWICNPLGYLLTEQFQVRKEALPARSRGKAGGKV